MIDEREFREALSCFATGVTIVTAAGDDGCIGMTVSSFNSVSMQPPLVLWSVTKKAASADQFRKAGHFSIHILSSRQQSLASRFATAGIDKFQDVEHTLDAHGVPHISDCVARFDCSQWAAYEGGDHWILVGEVQHFTRCNDDPLVFCEGAFAALSPSQQLQAVTGDSTSELPESPIDHLLLYNLSRAYHQMSRQFHGSVRASGLSIPQWRILASLYGEVTRALPDLQDRTFLQTDALLDALQVLQRDGLCKIDEGSDKIQGTRAGHDRVHHLFALGREQELAAADEQTVSSLIDQLAELVRSTNNSQ
jgi:flavin reductase (DIM6/NTAB) family NADH-FMN oxidoreductase RutF